jgi:hypothetical protein
VGPKGIKTYANQNISSSSPDSKTKFIKNIFFGVEIQRKANNVINNFYSVRGGNLSRKLII